MGRDKRTSDAERKAKRAAGKSKGKAALVRKVIDNIEARLKNNELKPTLGDFIRLVQLEKELEEEQPREVEVKWVEPSEKEDTSGT